MWTRLGVLTLLVLLVHGYHPLADDGAVYVAGIKKLLDPRLYPWDPVFALAPTRLSIFAHVAAALLRWTRAPLPDLLLLGHLASIFLFLVGYWKLAAQVFSSPAARWGAVLLAACCFTLPIAGTSLVLMDPYVTARSFSTPLSLFALAAVLEQRWLRALFWWMLVALLHPLMAAYAAIALAGAGLAQRRMWRSLGAFFAAGYTAAAVVFVLTHHAGPHLAYNLAALSRSYFFLSSWRWFEYLGLAMPLLLLAAGIARGWIPAAARGLTIAMTGLGTCALLTSLCFVHRGGSLWLARLQVLRTFQWVYVVGVLLAGGLLGTLSVHYRRTVAAIYVVIAMALFTGQRLTYAASRHVEWPWLAPINPWQQAFAWIRGHTPNDALFALDNDYIESKGEDAQGFRATAERSTVADYFKDGGIASNFPQAADTWQQGSQATAQLNRATDAERIARLQPLGVTWMVLPDDAETRADCPFSNVAVRVCRLGILLHGTDGAK